MANHPCLQTACQRGLPGLGGAVGSLDEIEGWLLHMVPVRISHVLKLGAYMMGKEAQIAWQFYVMWLPMSLRLVPEERSTGDVSRNQKGQRP